MRHLSNFPIPGQSVADISDPALFVLRSLTKSFAVPGYPVRLRFWGIGTHQKIETARSPWSVMLLRSHMPWKQSGTWTNWKDHGRDGTGTSLAQFQQSQHWPPQPSPSSANYILVECGQDASSLCNELIRKDILFPGLHIVRVANIHTGSPSAPTKRISNLSRRLQHACADHGRGGGEPAQSSGKNRLLPCASAGQ